MTTEAKVAANRRNAEASTGPTSEAGKSRASTNALQHGLRAAPWRVLPDEDGGELEDLRARIRADVKPAGELEERLADRVVDGFWKLSRAGRAEAALLTYAHFETLQRRAEIEAGKHKTSPLDDIDFGTVTDERAHAAARQKAEEAAVRRAKAPAIGEAFGEAAGGDALDRIGRYEMAAERSLFRALHELERLQAARAGRAVPAPAVVDVNVSRGE